MNIIMISAIVSAAALIGYVSFYFMGPDNQVEEACEEVIKVETGTTIDLSPNTSATGASGSTIAVPSVPALPSVSTTTMVQPSATDISETTLLNNGPTGAKAS